MGAGVDVAKLKEHFDDDFELFTQLVKTFGQIYKGQISELEESYSKKNYIEFERVAHSIKGGVANFYAMEAKQTAYELEKAGASKKLNEQTLKLLNNLSKQLNELEKNLKAIKF